MVLSSFGCMDTPEAPDPTAGGMPAEELVVALQSIAETGEYRDVQTELTIGLEKEGLMEEAVTVQTFNDLSQEEVKQAAEKLAKRLSEREPPKS